MLSFLVGNQKWFLRKNASDCNGICVEQHSPSGRLFWASGFNIFQHRWVMIELGVQAAWNGGFLFRVACSEVKLFCWSSVQNPKKDRTITGHVILWSKRNHKTATPNVLTSADISWHHGFWSSLSFCHAQWFRGWVQNMREAQPQKSPSNCHGCARVGPRFPICQKVDIWMIGCILYTLMFYRSGAHIVFQNDSEIFNWIDGWFEQTTGRWFSNKWTNNWDPVLIWKGST